MYEREVWDLGLVGSKAGVMEFMERRYGGIVLKRLFIYIEM